ncbi:AraC family transcriptional regulator [Phenylobacterium sp.]|uniref:AraC family transcriptional regulator n=1 Tax=Phenylobacterium sp. TaxID=1871053 RepID=UPI002E321586|nr:AraC family transcriptional regulator [Phenylobacterium sp.]HEX3364479.1 AraC family transcriptional regulator [Phenylobacterium sp.]
MPHSAINKRVQATTTTLEAQIVSYAGEVADLIPEGSRPPRLTVHSADGRTGRRLARRCLGRRREALSASRGKPHNFFQRLMRRSAGFGPCFDVVTAAACAKLRRGGDRNRRPMPAGESEDPTMDMRNQWETGVVLAEHTLAELPSPAAGPSPLSMVLTQLLDAAADAFDVDQERSRALLGQARVLLHSGAARYALTSRPPAQAVLAPWLAKRIARHIEDNLDRALPIGELAAAASLSNGYFTRAFKGTFGQAPHAFILGRRVDRARREMLAGHEPLAHIALSCGFADQAHLARIFRRAMGIAPSAWRRVHGAANLELPAGPSGLCQGPEQDPSSPTSTGPARDAAPWDL